GDNAFTSTAWLRVPVQGARLYLIGCTPLRCDNNNLLAKELETRWMVSDTAGNPPAPLGGATMTVDNSAPLITQFLFSIGGQPNDTTTVTFELQSKQAG